MGKQILFLDKVFLRGRTHEKLRGVEKFNIALLKDLLDLDCEVTVVATNSWKEEIQNASQIKKANFISVLEFGEAWMKALLSLPKLLGKRFDYLFLANVGNGIVPAVKIMHKLSLFPSCVILAHREASPYFVKSFKKIPTKVISVNSHIAKAFNQANYPVSDVYYGVTNHSRFIPKNHEAKREINFAVFGNLDSPWKGVDTAVAAFNKLPEQIKAKSKLHLAGFSDSIPDFANPNIVVYNWLNDNEVVNFLNKMDILIVPSRDTSVMKETFSQSMVQGMLSGLPLIVNNLPILTEKVDEGGGIIFTDEQGLIEAMSKLAEDSDLRNEIGKNARETALKRYAWNTTYFLEQYFS